MGAFCRPRIQLKTRIVCNRTVFATFCIPVSSSSALKAMLKMRLLSSAAVITIAIVLITTPTTATAQAAGNEVFGTCYARHRCAGSGDQVTGRTGLSTSVSGCQSFIAANKARSACTGGCSSGCSPVSAGTCADQGPYTCIKWS